MSGAVAQARRGPDILTLRSIPLSATTDQPLPDVPAPPVSASAHPDDLAAGVPKEISAEEMAAAEAAKKGVVEPVAEVVPEDAGKTAAPEEAPAAAKPTEPPEFDDGIVVPENLPGWAKREITKVRRQAKDRVAAALRTAQKDAGEAEWQRVYEANRDAIVAKAREDVAAAEKQARDAQQAAADAQRALDELRGQPKTDADPRPTRDQFDNPDSYDDALLAWSKRDLERATAAAKKVEDDAAAVRTAEEAQRAHEAAAAELHAAWADRRTKAVEKYPDYAEVTEALPEDGGPTITQAMAAAIVQVENGTDVAYHLGQNPEESVRIAQIANPFRQAIEIGRLAERLATPPRPARRARPVEHVETAPEPAAAPEGEPDMETYYKQRMANAATRRPFFPATDLH